MEKFELDTDFIELCNLLKLCGPRVSGGSAKMLIISGEVKVDGQVELRKKCKIRTGQIISVDSFKILVIPKKIS